MIVLQAVIFFYLNVGMDNYVELKVVINALTLTMTFSE